MTENCRVNDCQKRLLVAALKKILRANDDFVNAMPTEYEGDSLTDACDEARAILGDVGGPAK